MKNKIMFFVWFATYLTVGGIIGHFDGTGISFWANGVGMCAALIIGVLMGLNYDSGDKE